MILSRLFHPFNLRFVRVCWGATIIYYLTSAMRLWLGFFVVWVLYLISGIVTCCKMLCKCPQEGLFSSLSVLNVNSVLRQSPPATVRVMDVPTRLPDAGATHLLEDVAAAVVQTYSVLLVLGIAAVGG